MLYVAGKNYESILVFHVIFLCLFVIKIMKIFGESSAFQDNVISLILAENRIKLMINLPLRYSHHVRVHLSS